MPETRRPRRKRPGLPPLRIQVEVARRQIFGTDPQVAIAAAQAPTWEKELRVLLTQLAKNIGCKREDLRLDHAWMLRTRRYKPIDGEPIASWYTPHAHDPEWLEWKPQPPEFEGSHHVKTYVRGAKGQLSDTALAKRERRHEKDPGRWLGLRGLKKPKHKRKHKSGPKRAIRSRGFPPAGSRKLRRKQ